MAELAVDPDAPSCGRCIRYVSGPRAGRVFVRCFSCIGLASAYARAEQDAARQQQEDADRAEHMAAAQDAAAEPSLPPLEEAAAAWRELDGAVTAYMLGEVDGARVAQVQYASMIRVHRATAVRADGGPDLWHSPAPGPQHWDWRCLRCHQPVAYHPGWWRRLLHRWQRWAW